MAAGIGSYGAQPVGTGYYDLPKDKPQSPISGASEAADQAAARMAQALANIEVRLAPVLRPSPPQPTAGNMARPQGSTEVAEIFLGLAERVGNAARQLEEIAERCDL